MVRFDRADAPLAETAPAKINLTLTVRGQRPDGYHQLESFVAFAGAEAADSVDFVAGAAFRLEIGGAGAPALAGEAVGSNLIARAAEAVTYAVPQAATGMFRLNKVLPVAAGVGGGSADAAAALRLLRRANPELAARIDWTALAATIGADVPVCLESRASLMWGLGEHVAPLPALPSVWAVMANPRVALSTAAVFRALSAPKLRGDFDTRAAPVVPEFATLSDLIDFAEARANDLEAPAKRLCPVVSEVQALLAGLDGALLARMSGSGPTCFALFASADAATNGAQWLAAHRPAWWVQATALH